MKKRLVALILPILLSLSLFIGSAKAYVIYDHANFASDNDKFTVVVYVYKHEDVVPARARWEFGGKPNDSIFTD